LKDEEHFMGTINYRKLVWLILLSVLSLIVALVLRPYFSGKNAEAAKDSPSGEINLVNAEPMTDTSSQSASAPDVDAISVKSAAVSTTNTQTVNNIAIRVDSFRQDNEQVLIDVCFDLPDNSDWTIWSATLTLEGKTYTWSGWDPIEIRLPPVDGKQQVTIFLPEGGIEVSLVDMGVGQTGFRCDTVYFDGVPAGVNSTRYTLTIDALEAAPKEGEECTQAYLEKAQAVLDAKNSGITVKCAEQDYIGGLEIATKPESMSIDEAQSMLYDPEFYLDLNGIRGPWVFELEIK
jgi:hypothetical protein